MDEDPDLVELRGLWADFKNENSEAKSRFQEKLEQIIASERYNMSELARALEIKRPTLYYHRTGSR